MDVGEGSKNSRWWLGEEREGGDGGGSEKREGGRWWWLGKERGSEIYGGGSQREGESEFERERGCEEVKKMKKTKLSL